MEVFISLTDGDNRSCVEVIYWDTLFGYAQQNLKLIDFGLVAHPTVSTSSWRLLTHCFQQCTADRLKAQASSGWTPCLFALFLHLFGGIGFCLLCRQLIVFWRHHVALQHMLPQVSMVMINADVWRIRRHCVLRNFRSFNNQTHLTRICSQYWYLSSCMCVCSTPKFFSVFLPFCLQSSSKESLILEQK